MSHNNSGGNSHKNTGYLNHTNYTNHSNSGSGHVDYTDYNQSGYNNHVNNDTHTNYSNYNCYRQSNVHTDTGYMNHTDYTNHRNVVNGHTNYTNHNKTGYNDHSNYGNHTNYDNYKCYSQSGGYTQSGYNNHTDYTNYLQSTYTNHNDYSNHNESGYNNHTNTGYSNHVDQNLNIVPENVGNFNPVKSFYYKDTITINWNAIPNIGKTISVQSACYGDTNIDLTGIRENNVIVQRPARGLFSYYWDSNGGRCKGGSWDTYGDNGDTKLNEFKSFINLIPNGSYVAIGTSDTPANKNNSSAVHSFIKSLGFSTSMNKLEPENIVHDSFSLIYKKGSGVLAEESANATIPNGGTTAALGEVKNSTCVSYVMQVNSGQKIKYTVQYAFKEITSDSYGSWIEIDTTESTSINFNLSSLNSGFVKFRIIANDGIENSAMYTESSIECRILKYTAPSNWNSPTNGSIIYASDWNKLIDETDKFLTAYNETTSGITHVVPKETVMSKKHVDDLCNTINPTASTLGKQLITNDVVSKSTTIKVEHIKKIQDWLKNI